LRGRHQYANLELSTVYRDSAYDANIKQTWKNIVMVKHSSLFCPAVVDEEIFYDIDL